MNEHKKIGILCNGNLALPSLHAMLHNNLVAALGIPDKQHDAINDIRTVAATFNIKPATFTKQKLNESLEHWINDHKLDVVFVITFPWRIPEKVLSLPPLGFINFHFGLLPQFRGADAIFPTIKSRAPFGGITVHQMDKGFDTGPIIYTERIPVLPTDTYGMHSTKLANTNISVLQKVLPLIFSGNVQRSAQQEDTASYYSKPRINDISIQWHKHAAEEIVALVNACNPWNKGAYTMFNNMPLRITEAGLAEPANSKGSVGEITNINEKGIYVQCIGDKNILIRIITLEEGIYSATSFAQCFGIKTGNTFKSLGSIATPTA